MSSMIIVGFILTGALALYFVGMQLRTAVGQKKLQAISKLIESGNTRVALRHAKSLLNRNEKSIDAHWLLGECYRAENRPELALVEYRFIVSSMRFTVMVTERMVRSRLAEVFLELGQIEESQKELVLLAKLDPHNHEIFFNIAKLFEERDFSDSALMNYKRVISINPHHVQAHFRLGVILFNRHEYDEARDEFLTVLKKDENITASYYYLGKIARKSGALEKALDLFEKSLRDASLRQRAYFERASIFMMDKEYQQAIEELEKAVKIGERDLNAAIAVRYLLALCHETSKKLSKALEHWEWIYQKNPNYKDVAVKLSLYGALRADDKLKDFLIAPQEKFHIYCEKIANLLGLGIQQEIKRDQDYFEFTARDSKKKSGMVGRSLNVVRIIRISEPIAYEEIRGLYDKMRNMNASRGIYITASQFTKSAIEFAQIRPIDLIDKEELTNLLQDIPL
jgi:tetratricopeptide (TPR) repeat protein